MIMYSAVLPSYNKDKDHDKENKYDASKDANNPNLFKGLKTGVVKKK